VDGISKQTNDEVSMLKRKTVAALIAVAVAQVFNPVHAADNAEIQQIRSELEKLKQTDEARIQELEKRLEQAEAAAQQAQDSARQAAAAAAPPQKMSAFNPAVSLILSGIYSHLSQDPATYRISGFPLPADAEIGPGQRGFSLAESELGIYANVDPYFYGGLNFAIHPDDTASVEEGFIQTTALSYGFTLKAGRFFSGIGYLNEQHAHVWDFVDAPLAYQAFLGGQLGDDGVQLRWLAPVDTYVELGAELGRGRNYPGSDRDVNGAGATTVFGHVGGDIGVSNSWRAGLSMLATSPRDQEVIATDATGAEVTDAFSGDTRLWIADFVWKYAPNGNPYYTNFKLQGEYLRRRQDGGLVYDTTGVASPGSFTATQSGWYLQAVYQFHPYWRVGVRTEKLDYGSVDFGANSANLARPGYDPTKNSIMVDYNLSEFSRIRLQYARDKAHEDQTDNQLFVQYQMSLGAHGAHIF
jgi:hypothetical protein